MAQTPGLLSAATVTIGGKEAPTTARFDVINPATEEVLAAARPSTRSSSTRPSRQPRMPSTAGAETRTPGFAEVHRRPIGVVAAITPWNFPLTLAMWKIAPALRAGNTVVVKPSPYTPLTTLALGDLLRGVLPDGVLNVVYGPDPLGADLTVHPLVRKISFTGSTGIWADRATSTRPTVPASWTRSSSGRSCR
jgi:acyl-CoA reductase-like NAD-dependent aldehyde dehydrogenase